MSAIEASRKLFNYGKLFNLFDLGPMFSLIGVCLYSLKLLSLLANKQLKQHWVLKLGAIPTIENLQKLSDKYFFFSGNS